MYKDQTKPKIPAWLRDAMVPYFKPCGSVFTPKFSRYIKLHPVGFEFWYRARVAKFLLKKKFNLLNGKHGDIQKESEHLDVVIDHNFHRRWLFSRQRTEKLMNVLRCIGKLGPDSKILCIGPKNEAEILLLSLYGFKLENIVGIDLFSLGEKIQSMDMHNMKFPDNTFDVIYTSWTLKYAYDLNKVANEFVRVLKNGGMVATGYTQTVETTRVVKPGSELAGGLTDVLGLFKSHIDHVYWQEADEDPIGSGNHRITTIFSIKK